MRCVRDARTKHSACPSPHQSTGAPSTFDGSRMSSVAIVFDLGQTCHDERYRRTVNTVNRNPVIERIVTTASPIDLATIADVCDVDDSMEERPLFPATRSRFRLFTRKGSSRMSRSDCVWRISCPVRALRLIAPGVRVSGAGHSRENGDPGQSLKDTARPHRPFIRHRKTQVEVRLFFDIANCIIRAISRQQSRATCRASSSGWLRLCSCRN